MAEHQSEWMYLSRTGDGKYMLTKHKPIVVTVEGQDRQDSYIRPGDPVGFRGMCPQFWKSMGFELSRFGTKRIRLSADASDEVTIDKPTVQDLVETIELLHRQGATHKKRGFNIRDLDDLSVSVHLLEEAVEFQAECLMGDDKEKMCEEAADVLMVYLHMLKQADLKLDDVLAKADQKLADNWTNNPKEVTAKQPGLTRSGR